MKVEKTKMQREMIGLNRFLYTFTDYKDYEKTKELLKDKGAITIIYINNGYGFEFKRNKVIK